jgi:hypothetical protein
MASSSSGSEAESLELFNLVCVGFQTAIWSGTGLALSNFETSQSSQKQFTKGNQSDEKE